MTAKFATWADRDEVSRICAHPEVRKWTAHDGAGEFSPQRWITGKNLVVLGEGNCFLGQWIAPGHFVCHTNVSPEARSPKRTLMAATEALMLAFCATDAEVFTTLVPSNNKAASWLAQCMGFRPTFKQEKKWIQGGEKHDLQHWRLDIDDWILRGHLHPLGESFHRLLEQRGLGPDHADDAIHNCYVGAALAMVAAGKVGKGLRVYNRWALQAGYAPIALLSSQPLVLDAGTFTIMNQDGNLTVQPKEYEHA